MCRMAPIVAAAVMWIGLVVPAFGGRPGRPRVRARRNSAFDKGDYDGAIARLDEAVRLAPKQAKLLGMRGVAWLRKGEYAKGAADLKAAIAAEPRRRRRPDTNRPPRRSSRPRPCGTAGSRSPRCCTTGRRWPSSAKRPNSSASGRHASSPARISARPSTGTRRRRCTPTPNTWRPATARTPPSWWRPIYQSGPKQGSPRSFEELWAGAIYELHNVTYAREFVRLNDEADQGQGVEARPSWPAS